MLATPWQAVPDALVAAGKLAGKVLIDCTNPLRMGPDGMELAIGHSASGGEQVASLAQGASVFKTLNQTGFANMQYARAFAPLPAAMYVAGDDTDANPWSCHWLRNSAFRPSMQGRCKVARLLEPMAMLWIHMAINRGQPMTHAFALTQRS